MRSSVGHVACSPFLVAVAGGTANFTLTASTAGPAAATGVTVTDMLPAGFTFASSTPAVCAAVIQVVTCNVGDLAVGGQVQITLVANVAATATTAVTNTVVIAGAQPDPSAANNSANLDVTATPPGTTPTPTPTPTGPTPNPTTPALGTITGEVFEDANGNSTLDAGEPTIPGVVITLIGSGPDGQLDTSDDVVLGTSTTSSPYAFRNLAAGSYRVTVNLATLPRAFTLSGNASTAARVAAGQTVIVDFPGRTSKKLAFTGTDTTILLLVAALAITIGTAALYGEARLRRRVTT